MYLSTYRYQHFKLFLKIHLHSLNYVNSVLIVEQVLILKLSALLPHISLCIHIAGPLLPRAYSSGAFHSTAPMHPVDL